MTKKFIKILLVLLIALLFQIHIIVRPSYSFSPSTNQLYEGIDVSGWQGQIDFKMIKESGINIVYIKSSEGYSYIDPDFETNYESAKENGLLVGAYHYVTAVNAEEAEEQARFFASVVENKSMDCRLAMDFEYFDNLSNNQINQVAIVFLRKLEDLTGKKPAVYSDTYNATNTFSGTVTNYPLWVAQYDVLEPTNNYNWNTWAGWQYTSSRKCLRDRWKCG